MIDKSLVKKRFSRCFKTYNDNAVIQKQMAERLISLLPRRNYGSILEIGCATGVLSELIKKELVFKSYTANDIVIEAKKYIDEIIPENTFIAGDIEEIELNKKFDLIISNAALQWCENTEKTIEKLTSYLTESGILAVSIFANDNLKEIKTVLNLPNARPNNIKGTEETKVLYFKSPIEVLKHIKSTGANALTEYKFTKSSLKAFEEKYKALYESENGVSLTYKPLYIVRTNFSTNKK